MNINIKKLSFRLAIVMTISFVLAGIFLAADFAITKSNLEDINQEKIYDAENLKTLSIHTDSIPINILPNDGNEVELHLYGSLSKSLPKPELEEMTAAGGLSLGVRQKFVLVIGMGYPYHHRLKLDIHVPKKKLDSFDVYCSSGDINSSVAGADKNTLTANSGDIELNGMTGDISARCGSGNIVISKVKAGMIEIRNSSGDVNMENVYANGLTIRSSSGNITGGNITAVNTKITASSGSTRFNGFSGNIDASLNSGNLEIQFDKFESTTVITKADSGNTKLLLPENSKFKIKSKISSGNFHTDFQLSFDGFARKKDFTAESGSGSNNSISVRSSSGDIKILKK